MLPLYRDNAPVTRNSLKALEFETQVKTNCYRFVSLDCVTIHCNCDRGRP